MHGDLLQQRLCKGSLIEYVVKIESVRVSHGNDCADMNAMKRSREEEEDDKEMDVEYLARAEHEEDEEDERERRRLKKRVGEIASDIENMRLISVSGFNEGSSNGASARRDTNKKKQTMMMNTDCTGTMRKNNSVGREMMVRIRIDASRYEAEDEVWDEVDKAIDAEHGSAMSADSCLWAMNVVRLSNECVDTKVVSLDRLFRLSARPFASARARNLIALSISGCRDKTVNGFGKDVASAMANLPMLREFSAVGTNLGKEFIKRFAHVAYSLKKLEILKLSSNKLACDIETCESLSNAIENLQSLKVLDLSQNYLGENGIVAVMNAMIKRRRRSIDKYGLKPEALKILNIAHDSIGNAGAFSIAKMLKMYPDECWEKLDVSFNGILAQGAVAIADALSSSPSSRNFRRELDFRCNTVDFEGAAALARCLDGVRILNLSNNSIKDAGLKILSKSLKSNFTLTHFDVRGNDITSDGAYYISDCLSENATLQEISLDSNRIDNRGAIDLAENLALNPTTRLQILDLARNEISDEGGLILAQFLANSNVSIARLSLSSNRISEKATKTCESYAGLRIDVNWQKTK